LIESSSTIQVERGEKETTRTDKKNPHAIVDCAMDRFSTYVEQVQAVTGSHSSLKQQDHVYTRRNMARLHLHASDLTA
jgi:hypothetical protein